VQAIAPNSCPTHDSATAIALEESRCLNAEIGALTAKLGKATRAGVPCGPIYSVDQMFEDAQVQHLGIAEGRHIRLVGQPVTLSRTPSKMVARPPEFGEQTDEVLTEFGFTRDEIAGLRQAKVV
jgi:formyl-CoA transferase